MKRVKENGMHCFETEMLVNRFAAFLYSCEPREFEVFIIRELTSGRPATHGSNISDLF